MPGEERSRQFEAVVDAAEEQAPDDQELWLDLIQRRRSERWRAEIAKNIGETREENWKAQTGRGSVDELLVQAES